MSTFSKLALWLFISILTLSCQDRPSHIRRVLKEPNFHEFAEKQKVTCHDQEACSASVGNFIVYSATKNTNGLGYSINFGNCTGSLIAEDLVVTNRHCFIEKNTKAGDACSGVFVKFPKVREYPEQLAECKEIVFRPDINPKNEDENIHSLDVAIIRLKNSVKRPALKISPEGFKNNEWVTIHRFTTQENGSYLETLHCPVIQDAAIIETSRLASHPFSAFVYLANCPIIESNSGSPILDSRSSIKGVVSMFIDSHKVKQMFPAATEKYKDAAGGINLACVDHPSINPHRVTHPECALTLDWTKQKKISENRLKELQIDRNHFLKTKAAEFETKVARRFPLAYAPISKEEFDFFNFFTQKYYWFYPSCIESVKQLTEAYESLSSIPIFQDERTFDEAGRMHEKVEVEPLQVTSVKVVLAPGNKIHLKVKGRLFDKEESFSQELQLCGN